MIRLISSPYHLGHRGAGKGAGPDRIIAAGVVQMLGALGHQVEVAEVEPTRPFEHEVGAQFAVEGALAEAVRDAVEAGDFPFVLGGNCSSVLGVVGGLGVGDRGGVVWFDALGDANTPETTDSGFLGGMPVAVLTGRCWKRLAGRIPGFVPIADDHVLLAGVRSIDEGERALINCSQMSLAPPSQLSRDGFWVVRQDADRIGRCGWCERPLEERPSRELLQRCSVKECLEGGAGLALREAA
jgi:arginase